MIDFKALKKATNIEEVARGFLSLSITEDKDDSLRAVCPSCESEDPRAIIITPSKGLFYCFKSKKGGDLISLVAHCHGTSPKESAVELSKVYMDGQIQGKEPESKPEPKAETPKDASGFNPLKYISTLKCEQEDVSEFGIIAELCEEVGGMGLSTKGINRNRLAIPLRKEDGTLVAWVGVEGGVTVPKKWKAA